MAATTRARYARGEQRRRALIEAAAGLLLAEGLGALSHRAVAARAGLPLASTTYYFASVEDLRDEALQHVAEGWAARAEELVRGLPDRLDRAGATEAVAGIVGADAPAPQLLLVYERYLEAGRHPRLRPVVVAWNARLEGLVREVLTRTGLPAGSGSARLVLAVADGAAVTALAEGASPGPAVGAAVGRLLPLLRTSAETGPALA